MSPHALIVGGGLSGLAAGVSLSSRGVRVTILEQKPAPGGRAYSFNDAATGETVDNGQHLLIAGYEHTLRFLKTVGTRHLVRIQESPTLIFHHPTRGFREFRLPALPATISCAVAILGCGLFSPVDRLRLIRAGAALRLLDERGLQAIDHLTIAEWLRGQGQSEECIRSFWEPLAVSIMNEHVEVASAPVFLRAIRSAFLGSPGAAALAFPTVGLSELYVGAALSYITSHGGFVRCATAVEALQLEHGLISGVRLRDGTVTRADTVIAAVPPHKLLAILPEPLVGQFSLLSTFVHSPIVSLHLWFSRSFMPHPFTALIGRSVQWVFNRRLLAAPQGRGALVSAVISGAAHVVHLTTEELVRIAVHDLRSAYPALRESPYHAVVIKEKTATYSSRPAVESIRPPQHTGIPNFAIAGDWTATGYPATLEGAVRSAEAAAGYVLDYLVHSGGAGRETC